MSWLTRYVCNSLGRLIKSLDQKMREFFLDDESNRFFGLLLFDKCMVLGYVLTKRPGFDQKVACSLSSISRQHT